MNKQLGILGLLLAVATYTAIQNPNFLSAYNLQNTIRWTALFGIPSIGVAFVIITGGIDLSIGSVIGLVGSLLPWLLVEHGWDVSTAFALCLGLSVAIGLLHGLLITRLSLQPFVVTLCGLLFYRGIARWLTDDQSQGFGSEYGGLRQLATGKPVELGPLAAGLGVLCAVAILATGGGRRGRRASLVASLALAVGGLAVHLFELPPFAAIQVPTPFLILLGVAGAAAVFLGHTVWGRHLFALGQNEEAARYSGIRTQRMVILAYVICSLLAGLAGILFALDVNSVQPAVQGNFYELYAIAAAVLGGCSLRGGEGSILGVVAGAAVMRLLYNSINLLKIPTQLEFAIIGAVILLGVVTDELIRRLFASRRMGEPGDP